MPPIKKGGAPDGAGWGRLKAAGCVEGLYSLSLKGKVSPSAMSIKSALRDFLLCLQRCMTKSQSPLPQEGGGAAGDGG